MGQISAIATGQLEAWRLYGRRWILDLEYRVTEDGHKLGKGIEQLHLCCAGLIHNTDEPMPLGGCNGSIAVIYDGTNFVQYNMEMLEGLIIGHIRNVHRGLEEMVYKYSATH